MEGQNVRAVIANIEQQYPGVAARLLQGTALRPGLSVAVDGAVSSLGVLQPVHVDSEIHFLPAIAGG